MLSGRFGMRGPHSARNVTVVHEQIDSVQVGCSTSLLCWLLLLAVVGGGPSFWESVMYDSHLFNCDSYGKCVSLLGGKVLLLHFNASSNLQIGPDSND